MKHRLNLVVRSEKQYNKAVRKLVALDVREIFLTGFDERKVGVGGYGIGCSIEPNNQCFTDGTTTNPSSWENFYTVKSFINAVELALGELK